METSILGCKTYGRQHAHRRLEGPVTRTVALIALLTFMAGFALGRAVSFVTDGMPHPLFIAIFSVEILYSMAAIYLMKREANVPTSDRA